MTPAISEEQLEQLKIPMGPRVKLLHEIQSIQSCESPSPDLRGNYTNKRSKK